MCKNDSSLLAIENTLDVIENTNLQMQDDLRDMKGRGRLKMEFMKLVRICIHQKRVWIK